MRCTYNCSFSTSPFEVKCSLKKGHEGECCFDHPKSKRCNQLTTFKSSGPRCTLPEYHAGAHSAEGKPQRLASVAKNLAAVIVNRILDHGLANSTWRVLHPDAYNDLLEYREDITLSVYHHIRKKV
jgi:hypothetical protein